MRECGSGRSIVVASVLALTGCGGGADSGGASESAGDPDTVTLEVAGDRVTCEGEGVMECLQVRRAPDAEWERFYDQIEGFTHEPGYAYELRVRVTDDDPPADGSSLAYELVEVVRREPAD
ncbi:DUF4377 domain-containing protein [Egicoccus sp. AB-alg6-2]|uniref:DUF4377 domain-containing protein n=1 Tax=Egicoccus sp. AB-alg6-2 TaxID=3242692 RepID=UPI00359D6AA4